MQRKDGVILKINIVSRMFPIKLGKLAKVPPKTIDFNEKWPAPIAKMI